MAIVTLTSNETGANSLIDINANFVDLDTTKADLASPTFTGTPSLPTGTTGVTQSSGDNSTKLATTAYADAAGAITCVTSIPLPNGSDFLGGVTTITINTNTTMYIGQIIIPFKITANKISFSTTAASTPGTLDITMYSESGQTQIFAVTTASIPDAADIIETALSAVVINPGVYWIAVNPNSTAAVTVYTYRNNNSGFTGASSLTGGVSSDPVLHGTLAISAGIPPATITPTSVTLATNSTLFFRLDN